ncbi:hypothetical protein ACFPRL_09310 [Pseudoclavibacter helvolus]
MCLSVVSPRNGKTSGRRRGASCGAPRRPLARLSRARSSCSPVLPCLHFSNTYAKKCY